MQLHQKITANFLFQRGLAKNKLQDHTGAREDILRSIELFPENPDSFNTDNTNMDTKSTLDYFNEVIAIYPEWPNIYYWRAEYAYGGIFELGISDIVADLTKALDLRVTEGWGMERPEIHNEMIAEIKEFLMFIYEGRFHGELDVNHLFYDNAEHLKVQANNTFNELTRLIEICPDWDEPYFNRGRIRIEFLFDFTGAIEDFSRVIELNPDNPDAYFNRGEAKYKLQDYVGARTDYNAAVAIKPNVGNYYGDIG